MVAHTRLNVALYVHCLSYYYITQEHGYPSFGGCDALLLQSLSTLPIFHNEQLGSAATVYTDIYVTGNLARSVAVYP